MDRENFKNRLRELVEIPSIREKEKLEESSRALDLIESWTTPSALKKRYRNGKAEILLLGNKDLINPKFGYLVHVDVVDGAPEMFKMREDSGKLIGRGVSDMKYSIPIGIETLNQLLKNRNAPAFTIAITTDEEIGGGEGGNYLANELKFIPQVLIVPDGGDGFVFVNKSKGVVHIWIESKGIPTHASTPWLGKNALTPITRLANKLLDRYDSNSEIPNWETTMNMGVLQGGVSTNQVCETAILKLDFRFPESRSIDEIVREVRDAAFETDKKLVVKLAASGEPTFTDISKPEVARFLEIAKEILGKDPKIEGEEGASDARYWAKYNVPIIMTKPTGGGIHSANEWIDTDSCLTYFEILYKYVSESN